MSKPGERVQLDVWRQGAKVQLAAELANATDKVAKTEARPDNAAAGGKLGLAPPAAR